MKVLLLEDNDHDAMHFINEAQNLCEVVRVKNNLEATKALIEDKFPFAFLDQRLGKGDEGMETLLFIKANKLPIACIILSGIVNLTDAIAANAMGAKLLLKKPITARMIEHALTLKN